MDGRGPDFGGSLGSSQDQPLPPRFSTSFIFFSFSTPHHRKINVSVLAETFSVFFLTGASAARTRLHICGFLQGGGGTREVCVWGVEGGGGGNCGLVSIMFPWDSPCPDFTLPSGALVWALRAPPVFSLVSHFEGLIDGVIKASPQ